MSFPAQNNLHTRVAALLGIGCLQFFFAEGVAAFGWAGHYSYRTNFISDLGAIACVATTCSHWHALMNASFFLQAVLIAAGALLMPLRVSPGWAGVTARVLLLFSAFGIYDVAIAPEDININKHIFGAGLHFFSASLAMLLWGISLALYGRGRPASIWRSRRIKASLLAAAVAALGDLLIYYPVEPLHTMLGTGLIERLAAYPLPLWLAWTGWTVLRRERTRVRYSQADA